MINCTVKYSSIFEIIELSEFIKKHVKLKLKE